MEIVDESQLEKMRQALFDKHNRWSNFTIAEKIQFYQCLKLPEKFIGKIYVAYLLLINGTVTEERHNPEVTDEVISWFERN